MSVVLGLRKYWPVHNGEPTLRGGKRVQCFGKDLPRQLFTEVSPLHGQEVTFLQEGHMGHGLPV